MLACLPSFLPWDGDYRVSNHLHPHRSEVSPPLFYPLSYHSRSLIVVLSINFFLAIAKRRRRRKRTKEEEMHRSASTSRTSEEYYMSMTTGVGGGGGKGLSSSPGHRSSLSLDVDHLPTYDPLSDAAKKEALRARFAENMVHLIPLVLILCAMVLWFFSHPEIDVAVNSVDSSIVSRIRNMAIDGYSSNWNGSSMTIGLEDLDPIDGIGVEDAGRFSNNKDNK